MKRCYVEKRDGEHNFPATHFAEKDDFFYVYDGEELVRAVGEPGHQAGRSRSMEVEEQREAGLSRGREETAVPALRGRSPRRRCSVPDGGLRRRKHRRVPGMPEAEAVLHLGRYIQDQEREIGGETPSVSRLA